MREKQDSWVPITEVKPSGLFICTYRGPFAPELELNQGRVGNFLNMASLDGRVWLKDGEGTNLHINPDSRGWVVSTGREISQGISAPTYARRFNRNLIDGLSLITLKDKCTLTKDPFLAGRMVGTTLLGAGYMLDVIIRGLPVSTAVNLTILYLMNHVTREVQEYVLQQAKKGEWGPFAHLSRAISFTRRTIKSRVETFDFPFEFDRLAISLGYLQLQRLQSNPLIRLAG